MQYDLLKALGKNLVTKDQPTKGEAEPQPDDKPKAFKIGDKVIPSVGPHKGVKHLVIHVNSNGTINIRPIGLDFTKIAYRRGAAAAKPEQLELAEAVELAEARAKLVAEKRKLNERLLITKFVPKADECFGIIAGLTAEVKRLEARRDR